MVAQRDDAKSCPKQPSNRLKVLGTGTAHRRFAKGDYVISIHKRTKKDLGIGRFAVVGYRVHYQGSDECKEPLLNKGIGLEKILEVHARVVAVGDNVPGILHVNTDEIRIDQSIRNAIGIPYTDASDVVEIFPVRMHLIAYAAYLLRYFISRILGFRYFFYRVCSAHVHDMEKGICRIPGDTFAILGTEAENNLVFESPKKVGETGVFEIVTKSIASYELTNEIKSLRLEKEVQKEIRYRNPKSWISVEPDISRVFLDQADRERLGVDQLSPVKARRDVSDLLQKQILGVGIFFFVSALSLGGLWPLEKTWMSFILILIVGLIMALGLMIVILRTRIK